MYLQEASGAQGCQQAPVLAPQRCVLGYCSCDTESFAGCMQGHTSWCCATSFMNLRHEGTQRHLALQYQHACNTANSMEAIRGAVHLMATLLQEP